METSRANPGFPDAGKREFGLRPSSSCVVQGVSEMEYVHRDGLNGKMTVRLHCVPHMNLVPRVLLGNPDIGAYELGLGPKACLLSDDSVDLPRNLLRENVARRGKLHPAKLVLHRKPMLIVSSSNAIEYIQ